MKVIQTVSGIGKEAAGTSYCVPGICRGLRMAGVDVQLHTRMQNMCNFPFDYVAYEYKRSLGLPDSTPAMLKGLKEACRTADIIHANGLWNMPSVYPVWAVKNTKCRLVISPHGTLAPWALRRSWLVKKIFGNLFQYEVLKRAAMFHATCEKEYEEIRALGYKQPVAIVPIGMDIPKGKCSVDKNDANRLRRIVFFGRIHKVKAVDNLVRAWGDLHLNLPNWELVIAGPDCGAKGKLEEIIKELDIPRVRFTGELKGQAKYDFLADADIYVLPSHTENFGVTVAEALASGVPTIASQGTPWKGLEVEGCGRWVSVGVAPLVEALKALTSLSDQERTAMGEKGIEWMRRDFSWRGVGEKMKVAYEWLLGMGDKPNFIG